VAQFKRGDFSTCDEPRPGRPKTVTTPEIIDQIEELILGDRRISAKSIAERLVTMDETWLYHYGQETKQQSMEWRHSGSPRTKIFRVQKSAGKVLASIFWDKDGIILTDYVPKGQTSNAEYYSSLLVQLKDILKEKHREREGHKRGLVLERQCPGSHGTCNPEGTGLPGLPLS